MELRNYQKRIAYRAKRIVGDRTGSAGPLRAGTRYPGIPRSTRDGLIEETDPPAGREDEAGERWRFYAITPKGRRALETEIARLEADVEAARRVVRRPA